MNPWLTGVLHALAGRKIQPAPQPIPIAPDWTAVERDQWKSVLNSPTGKKMIARAKAVQYKLLDDASKDHFHAAQNVHAARGFGEAIIWLQTLSVSCSVEPSKPATNPDKEKPAAVREIEEYESRISP